MKSPEKIYLFENPIDNTPDYRWLSKRSCDEDVEYTRTDAFIEKAVRFIRERLIFEDTRWHKNDEQSLQDKVIEDFKNYIKEE